MSKLNQRSSWDGKVYDHEKYSEQSYKVYNHFLKMYDLLFDSIQWLGRKENDRKENDRILWVQWSYNFSEMIVVSKC